MVILARSGVPSVNFFLWSALRWSKMVLILVSLAAEERPDSVNFLLRGWLWWGAGVKKTSGVWFGVFALAGIGEGDLRAWCTGLNGVGCSEIRLRLGWGLFAAPGDAGGFTVVGVEGLWSGSLVSEVVLTRPMNIRIDKSMYFLTK